MGIGALGAGLLQGGLNYRAQMKNLQFQKDQAHNMMQWRVEDLKKAGLSPVLATGSQSPSPINTTAPQLKGLDTAFMNAMTMAQMGENIAKTEAEKQLIERQKNKVTADTMKANIEAGIKAHDLKIYEGRNTPSTDSGLSAQIDNMLNYFTGSSKSKMVQGAFGSSGIKSWTPQERYDKMKSTMPQMAKVYKLNMLKKGVKIK